MTRVALTPLQAPAYATVGTTGATAASRYAGGTASGAPSTGTFALGDFVVAQNGHVFICTAAGSPGTWVDAGGGGTPASTVTTESGLATGVVGTSTNYAREDHRHAITNLVDLSTNQTVGGNKTLTGYIVVNGFGTTHTTYGDTTSYSPLLEYTPQSTATATNVTVDGGFQVGYVYWNGTTSTRGSVSVKATATDVNGGSIFIIGAALRASTFTVAGAFGTNAVQRFVGGTATGAPSSGQWITGDWLIAQDGHVWICTAGGFPGTWVSVGAGGGSGTPATTVVSETGWGQSTAVGTATNYAREDHSHGTAATPATSVAGRTGAVTLTAADIGAGTFPGANSFTGLQTMNAGLTLPSGQALTTGTRSVVTGTRAVTTNASDTVDLGAFSTTGGALELRVHAHLAAPGSGAIASVTKIYEIVANALMGTVSTWYLVLPADTSAGATGTNDFALEVQRTASGTFSFRFRQKSIGVAGQITFTIETLGDTVVTFTPSTTVTAAPAAVTTPHTSNAVVMAAGQVGIGTETPGFLLDVAGATNAQSLAVTGLTGATSPTRRVGGTVAGAPTTGTFALGDFVVGQDGSLWVCTVAGSPGTWTASAPNDEALVVMGVW